MPEMSERLLDLAQEFIQTRGYNAFSYRDLADATGITTASIHYHFRTKSDLGQAVVVRYRERLIARLVQIDSTVPSCVNRIRHFTDLFVATLERSFQMCLCGMLAAEQRMLPPELNREVVEFFSVTETWLTQTLREGIRRGEIADIGPVPRFARNVLATLEGAMLVARVTGEQSRLTEVISAIKSDIRKPVAARSFAAETAK